MEVALIILGAFVLLLFIVVVLLGNEYLKAKNRLKEVETDLEEYTKAAREDAKTICALRREIESLKTERLRTKDKEQFHLFDEEKMAIDISIKALNHTIVDESDRGLAADLLTKLKQRLNDFII